MARFLMVCLEPKCRFQGDLPATHCKRCPRCGGDLESDEVQEGLPPLDTRVGRWSFCLVDDELVMLGTCECGEPQMSKLCGHRDLSIYETNAPECPECEERNAT